MGWCQLCSCVHAPHKSGAITNSPAVRPTPDKRIANHSRNWACTGAQSPVSSHTAPMQAGPASQHLGMSILLRPQELRHLDGQAAGPASDERCEDEGQI